jgi:hypothetical protein
VVVAVTVFFQHAEQAVAERKANDRCCFPISFQYAVAKAKLSHEPCQ